MTEKALILTCEGYKDYEGVYPYYRLLEENFEVDVMSNTLGKVFGILGSSIPCNLSLQELTMDKIPNIIKKYDILIVPGGVNSLEKLRLSSEAVSLVKEWCKSGKVFGSICSGAQMLISARVIEGKNISAYYSMEQDVWNAGANFVDSPVVVDGNIVTSPHYKWVGNWMKAILENYRSLNNEPR